MPNNRNQGFKGNGHLVIALVFVIAVVVFTHRRTHSVSTRSNLTLIHPAQAPYNRD